jgi:hypothetical protein
VVVVVAVAVAVAVAVKTRCYPLYHPPRLREPHRRIGFEAEVQAFVDAHPLPVDPRLSTARKEWSDAKDLLSDTIGPGHPLSFNCPSSLVLSAVFLSWLIGVAPFAFVTRFVWPPAQRRCES